MSIAFLAGWYVRLLAPAYVTGIGLQNTCSKTAAALDDSLQQRTMQQFMPEVKYCLIRPDPNALWDYQAHADTAEESMTYIICSSCQVVMAMSQMSMPMHLQHTCCVGTGQD